MARKECPQKKTPVHTRQLLFGFKDGSLGIAVNGAVIFGHPWGVLLFIPRNQKESTDVGFLPSWKYKWVCLVLWPPPKQTLSFSLWFLFRTTTHGYPKQK